MTLHWHERPTIASNRLSAPSFVVALALFGAFFVPPGSFDQNFTEPSELPSINPHLRGTTVHDWPLNVFNDKDAADQLSILRAIASSDLHNLVYRANYRIVPAVKGSDAGAKNPANS